MLINKTFTSTREASPFELIWTNPNPTSSFSSQVITLPTGYMAFAVEILWRTGQSNIQPATFCIPFFEASRFYTAITIVSSAVSDSNPQREIKYARDGAISFGDAIRSGSVANDREIPLRIWGLKFSV